MKLTNELGLSPNFETNFENGGWTLAKRQAQRETTFAQKPWLAATGPKTAMGKKRSSRNALKHGQRSARTIRFKRILRQAKKYLAFVKALNRMERERRRAALGLIQRIKSPLLGLAQKSSACKGETVGLLFMQPVFAPVQTAIRPDH